VATKRQLIMVVAATLALLLLSGAFVTASILNSKGDNAPGDAPEFSVTDIKGNTVSSEDLKGKVVVLNLLVIYCGGIVYDKGKAQVAQMREAWTTDSERAVFLTVTSENCPTTDLDGVVRDLNISWQLVNDWPDVKIYGAYSDYFSKHGDPTMIIIDVNWNVVKHAGFMGHEDISKNITKALEGNQETDPIESSLGLAGMFALGIATSLAPCSIALLATMMMFLISRRGKEDAGAEGRPEAKPKAKPKDGRASKTDKENKDKVKDIRAKEKNGRSSLLDGLVIGLFFTLGTVAVFILLGLFVGYVSVFVSLSPVFFVITGIILILLGFNSIFNLVEKITGFIQERLSRGGIKEALPAWARFITKLWGHSSELGAFMLGIMFSLAWAPCAVSLVLPVIVVLLAAKVDLLAGCALLFFFGLGHGMAIIPIAVVSETSKSALTKRYMAIGRYVALVFGGVVIVMGFLFILRGFGYYLW